MPNHPYKQFEATLLWQVLAKEIDALVANGDLSLTTASVYVVGSLCKAVTDAGLTTPHANNRASST